MADSDFESVMLAQQAASPAQTLAEPNPTETFPVLFNDGSFAVVDRDTAEAAISLGGRLATPEEQHQKALQKQWADKFNGSLLGQAAGAGLAFTEGAVPRIALKHALTDLAGYDESEAQAAIDASQESTIGKVAGLGGMLAGPGKVARGVGLLAKPLAAATKLGRLGTYAAMQAAEGAAFGAYETLNEDSIQNIKLASEHLVSNAILGGIVQTALGVPLGAITGDMAKTLASEARLAKKAATSIEAPGAAVETVAAPTAAEREAYKTLEMTPTYEGVTNFKEPKVNIPMAERLAQRAAVGTGHTAEQVLETSFARTPQAVENRALGDYADKILQGVERTTYKAGRVFSEASEDILSHSKAPLRKQDFEAFAPKLRVGDVMRGFDAAKDAFSQAITDLDGLYTGAGEKSGGRLIEGLTHILREGEAARASGGVAGMSFAVDEMRKAVGRESVTLSRFLEKGGQATYAAARNTSEVASEVFDLYEQLRQVQRNTDFFGDLATVMGEINGAHHEQILAATDLFKRGYLQRVQDARNPWLYKTEVTPKWGSLVKEANDQAIQEFVVPSIKQYVNAGVKAAEATVRGFNLERLSPTLQKQAAAATVLEHQFRLGSAIAEQRQYRNDIFARQQGFAQSFAKPIAFGIGGLAAHSPLGGAAAYAGAKAFTSVGTAAGAWQLNRSMDAFLSDIDKQVAKTAKNLVSGQPIKGPPGPITGKNYNQIATAINSAASNPNWLSTYVGPALKQLTNGFPKLIVESQIKTQQALQALAAAMPVQTQASNPLQPKFSTTPPPSQYTITKANRVLQGVTRPGEAVQSPNKDNMAAVQQVWPEFHSAVQNKVVENLALAKQPMPFSQRQKLSQVTGIQMDLINEPERVRLLQQTYSDQFNATTPPAQSKPRSKPVKSIYSNPSTTETLELGGSYRAKRR